MQIYRSREVGQSYVTSVWTTIVAILHALWLMIRIRPQVVWFFLSECFSDFLWGFFIKPFESGYWLGLVEVFQILCNGPGTCIPLCVIAFLFKVYTLRKSFIKILCSSFLYFLDDLDMDLWPKQRMCFVYSKSWFLHYI